MEAALLSGSIKVMLPKLFSLVEKIYNRHKNIKTDINFLKKELGIIVCAIDDELNTRREENHGAVLLLSIEDLRELAHGIEDCIDSLVYRASWKQRSSVFRRSVQSPKALLTTMQFAQKLRGMKQKVIEAHDRRQRSIIPGQISAATRVDESPSSATDPRIMEADLVGIDEPRAKLLEQLAETGQPKQQLKVISIVGCWGLGKTALAADVYKREAGSRRFQKHAWVHAAHKCPGQVLADMLRELSSGGAPSCQGSVLNASSVGQLCVDVRKQLVKKRYLIVIDDIQTQDQWKTIKSAFPDDKDVGSRVVVTTTIQSVANACSSANGYVHKMSRLDENCSKRLFTEKACPKEYSRYKQPDPTIILKKCDGQPLALVTIGEFMQSNGWPKGPTCEDVCNDIRYHLETEEAFEDMRRVMMRNYASLHGHAIKACMLYFGMFPSNHPIRRKSLFRRWLAEGIVEAQDSCGALNLAAKNFNKLMDRNIIEPIDVSNNDNVKTCQIYGMMREFILQLSISQNFFTLVCDDKKEGKYVRRLSLHKTAEDGDSFKNIDLSLVRSLTIFGKACKTVLDFSKYELLRVLDLEKCDDLKDDHLKGIGNLLLLKYLSLGGSVTRLPADIAKLEHLEALDVRRTKVNILPVEVFMLPCLIHILGKCKLSGEADTKSVFLKNKSGREIQKFLKEGKSNMETLAGFVTDGSEGFLHLLGHMKKLRKVKIWCKPSKSSTGWCDLMNAIQQFIWDEKVENNDTTRSLSVDFDECSEKFLDSLKGPCYLSSLKLHGNLTALPQFFSSLRGLRELCLSTGKLTTGILAALSNLSYLQYLKLIAHDLEKFTIEVHALPRLLRLCLELQCPTFPTINQGALSFLVTLQLLCKDLNGLSDINIECFEHLEEVTLHPGVSQETRKQWEKAAKKHPNGPKVLLLKSDDEAESSNDQLNPAFSNMEISEVSPALNELSSGIVVP